VLGAPQSKAWWFIAGNVIHTATEELDHAMFNGQGRLDPAEVFAAHWDAAVTALNDEGIALESVKAGGRKSERWPDKENHEFWRAEGPGMVQGWVRWRDRALDQGWQFYLLPNGDPAVEVPVEVAFNDVLVKGYIDRVMINPNGELIVVDLKSGSRVPDSTLQLGIYALGFARSFGTTPALGAYYMTRRSELSPSASLIHYTPEVVGDWFSAAKRGIEGEVFIPHVGPFCGTCAVAPYCTAVGGNPQLLNATSHN
jgi:putative RecB family exonuclease